MKNPGYMCMVMDSAGGTPLRWQIRRRCLQGGVVFSLALAMASLAALPTCLRTYQRAAEAKQLLQHNAQLRRSLAQLQERLEPLQHNAWYTELSFAQLEAKSGLGVQTPPHAASEGARLSSVQDTDALFQALTDLETQQRHLQSTLGDILEYFYDTQWLLSYTPSIRPARTPWLSSSFGKRRDPMLGLWLMHKGLDLAGAMGMDILAPADGVVIWIGRRGGYGQTLVIDHGNALQTHFAHLSKYRVKAGDSVRRGEVIAEMGSTGKSTGPHLHYEIRCNGQPLDPTHFILD